ncbi:hypothetical protein LY76DRAFT_493636, partial [Colletotrichum caudatum]
AKDWAFSNPKCSVVIAGSLIIMASPGLVATPLLTGAGFGAKGVVANTAAASIQSLIGNVAPHSTFATLTSAGMGGYGKPIVYTAVQVGFGVAAASCGTYIFIKQTSGEEE